MTFQNTAEKLLLEKFAWGLEIQCGFVHLLWDMVSITLGAAVISSGVLSMVIFWLAFWFYNSLKNETPHSCLHQIDVRSLFHSSIFYILLIFIFLT